MLDHARPVLGGPDPTIGPPVPMGAPGIEEAASALGFTSKQLRN